MIRSQGVLRTLVGALVAGVVCRGAVDAALDDRGVVRFGGDLEGVRAVVAMHGPAWSYASAESGGQGERHGDRIDGKLRTPQNCRGDLQYAVRLECGTEGVDVSASLTFTEETDIQGAYVSFFLPQARFQGCPAALPYGETSSPLPAGDAAPGLSGTATAFTADLADGRSLVIAADASATVLVQNSRLPQANQYEVRFHLWGKGRSMPGLTAQRRFRVAVVPAAGKLALVTAMNPKTALDVSRPYALVGDAGQVSIRRGQESLAEVFLAIHGEGWSYASQSAATVQATGTDRQRLIQGRLAVPGANGPTLDFAESASAAPTDGLTLDYRLRFPQSVRLNGFQTAFTVPLAVCAGTDVLVTLDGGVQKTVRIGRELADKHLFTGPVTAVALPAGRALGLRIEVDSPTALLVQDNRGWGGDTVEFRFNYRRAEAGAEVPAGEAVARRFVVRLDEPLQVVVSESAAPVATDTAGWQPFVLPWDSAPVDVSFLNHKPAGKFGFVTVKEGRFVLADTGEPIRFWGTCFSAGANFPSHEQSEKIARRLACFGVNVVRTHHADAVWAERHLFRKDRDHTREFDAENLDRFDYLMHCLKREGIYVYLDQLVHRHFKTGDGCDAVADLPPAGKPYSNFDPALIALQKEYSRALWTHVNPYTGLAYKDDPAIALMEFANENDLFTQTVTLEPYRARFEQQYRAWAAARQIALPAGPVDFAKRTDALMRFFVDVQKGFYAEMSRYLRDEVGVRVPLTGSNWTRNAALLLALEDLAYTDSHAYWGHPSPEGRFDNRPMLAAGGPIMDGLGFQRLAGKPFFVSEWDEPWPNEWRAELPLWMAAAAAFQDWNGLTVYTYRHSVAVPCEALSGAFETFNDPARFGLFANAALLFRRGDAAAGAGPVAVCISRQQAAGADSPTPWSVAAYRGLSESRRFATVLGDVAPAGYTATPHDRKLAGEIERLRAEDARR